MTIRTDALSPMGPVNAASTASLLPARLPERGDGPPAPRWALGVTAGSAAALVSLTPRLLPRSRADQTVVAGLSFAAAYAATTLLERIVDRADAKLPGGAIQTHAVIAAGALAVPATFMLVGSPRHPLALGLAGAGVLVGSAATFGVIADVFSTELRDPQTAAGDDAASGAAQLSGEVDGGLFGTSITPRVALAGALLIAGSGAALFARKLSTASHAKTAAHMAAGTELAGTLIPRSTLGREGAKFVDRAARDASFVKDPIRVFASMSSADTPAARAALAVAELERQGGLHRSWLLVASPTGTGWINNMPVAAAEHFAKGDFASVAVQYSTKPSSLSLQRLGVATESNRELIEALNTRIRELHPDGGGPRLLLYGESLGAWAQQRMYGAKPSLLDVHRVAGTLWAGKPYHAQWSASIRPDIAVDASSLDDLASLPSDRARAMRVLSFAQANDPVPAFSFGSMLAKGTRPSPYDRHHIPFVTFFQGLADMKNALPTQPTGHYVTRGHDYSGVYAELARRAFHFDDVPATRVPDVMRLIATQERSYASSVEAAGRALAGTSG